ncbi:unnamed protein product [Prunus armeniaca]|uniref:Uncharacterized protein n=1 Tax=Prunus armeniaca TaxID=36596 RepID=A0A6J5W164_PRUAR|nr:unnamed protein product [Prunus armeniaca]
MKHKIEALNPLTYTSCGGGSFSGGGDSGLFCLGLGGLAHAGGGPGSTEDPAMARCGAHEPGQAHGKIRPVILPSGS